MDKRWSIFEKNRLLSSLKTYISFDSCWLTHEDQSMIEAKIDELSQFIDERYETHGRMPAEQ